MDYGPFGVRFLFFNTKKERRSIDELLIYFATPPFSLSQRQAQCLTETEGFEPSCRFDPTNAFRVRRVTASSLCLLMEMPTTALYTINPVLCSSWLIFFYFLPSHKTLPVTEWCLLRLHNLPDKRPLPVRE